MQRSERLVDDGGVTIVEMIVAVAILGIVMSGVTMTVINSLDLSRQNANRIVAANLAAGEVEALRSLPFEDLVQLVADGDGDLTETRVVDGRGFEISRSLYWSTNQADTGRCASAIDAGDANVLRVEVEVGWSRTMGVNSVRSDATVAPPIGLYDIQGGSIAVYVADHQVPAGPVSGASVVLYGPIGDLAEPPTSDDALTDADGCAVFDDLTPGAYRAAVGRTGYIDIDQRVSPTPLPVDASSGVNQDGGVAVRSRSWMEFRYAPAGTVTVDAVGWAGGELPVTPLSWYLSNTRGSFEGAELGVPADAYPTDYELWAGTCPDADPAGVDPSDDSVRYWPGASRGSSVSVDPLGNHTGEAIIGSLDIVWPVWVEEDLTRTVTLSATHEGTADCSQGTPELDLGSVTVGVDRRLALPFGSWRITASEGGQPLAEQLVVIDPAEQHTVPTMTLDGLACVAGPPSYVGHTAAPIPSEAPRDREIPVPDGTQVGDLLVLEAYVEQGAAFGAPAGFVPQVSEFQQDGGPSGGGSTRLRVWTKLADASDVDGSVTLTRPSNDPGGVALLSAYRNVAGGSPTVVARDQRSLDSDPEGGGTYIIDSYLQVTAPSTHTHALYLLGVGSNHGDGDFAGSSAYLTQTPMGSRPQVALEPGAGESDPGPPWASLMSLRRVVPGSVTVEQSVIGWGENARGASYLLVFPGGCEVD